MSRPQSASEYYSFDEQAIANAREAAKRSYEGVDLHAAGLGLHEAQSTLSMSGGCIGIIVKDGKVCLHIPVVDKDVCIPIPIHIPDGTVAEACLTICYKLGLPSGVCVEVRALGNKVAGQCWGLC